MFSKYDTSRQFLSKKEKLVYLARAQAGDADARKRLITSHQAYVERLARRYNHKKRILDEDAVQAGKIGLNDAITRFDSNNGAAFMTYAHWYIRGAIQREILEHGSTISVPVNLAAYELGYHTTVKSTEAAQLAAKNALYVKSLDEPVRLNDEPDSKTLYNRVSSAEASPEDDVLRMNTRKVIARLVSELTPRERQVIERRYLQSDDVDGEDGDVTLQTIGDELRCTRERIRQIEARALVKLRHAIEASPELRFLVSEDIDARTFWAHLAEVRKEMSEDRSKEVYVYRRKWSGGTYWVVVRGADDYLGSFSTEEAALRARDRALK